MDVDIRDSRNNGRDIKVDRRILTVWQRQHMNADVHYLRNDRRDVDISSKATGCQLVLVISLSFIAAVMLYPCSPRQIIHLGWNISHTDIK